jgi:hypothetical protein
MKRSPASSAAGGGGAVAAAAAASRCWSSWTTRMMHCVVVAWSALILNVAAVSLKLKENLKPPGVHFIGSLNQALSSMLYSPTWTLTY